MTDKETLPLKATRKLNMLILHNEALAKDKSLQEKNNRLELRFAGRSSCRLERYA